MKLKTVEIEGKFYAEVQEGKPVYVHDDGKEVAFDAAGTVQTISRLNAEAKTHREGKEAAEKALKAFEGIEDPKAARDALQTIANLDAKKLVDAGEIEKVKGEISKAFQAQLDEANAGRQALEQQLYSEKIGGSFTRSKLIADKFAIPADLVQARFGQSFKVEEGRIVAYDPSGNKIYSRTRPGEIADFDEAIEALVDQYPYKEQILKPTGASGSGAHSRGDSHGGGSTQKGSFTGSSEERLAAIRQKFPELQS
ncbi:MAG: DUF6651 domain-containing protein [Pusillimonas sp.]